MIKTIKVVVYSALETVHQYHIYRRQIWNSSMGLTPLGSYHGYRSGEISIAIVRVYLRQGEQALTRVLNILNKKSGCPLRNGDGIIRLQRLVENAAADGSQSLPKLRLRRSDTSIKKWRCIYSRNGRSGCYLHSRCRRER